ncbi:MAG: DUF2189 domain-containing protein, partial [Bacteroidales bacterium]|nr:DUF2189 domain-containing protein [Bacteroidales bacterium]
MPSALFILPILFLLSGLQDRCFLLVYLFLGLALLLLDGLQQLLSLENLEFLMVYFAVGLIFATLVFAVSVVSIPLMLDRDQDAISA